MVLPSGVFQPRRMTPITIDDVTYQVPDSWEDLTLSQYLDYLRKGIDAEDNIDLLSLETSIPRDILERVSLDWIGTLTSHTAFLRDPASLEPYKYAPKELADVFNMGSQPLKNVLEARVALNETPQGYEMLAAGELIRIFTGEDMTGLKVTEAIPYASFFLTACIHLRTASKA